MPLSAAEPTAGRSGDAELARPGSTPDATYLHPFSNPKVAIGLLMASLLLLAFFYRFAEIDLAISGWFFTLTECPPGAQEAVCGAFAAASHPVLAEVRNLLQYFPIAVAITLMIAAILAAYSPSSLGRRFARGAATAIASLLISALLIVNLILKEFSGRPRPIQIELFAGDLPFVEAGRFTDYCASNCSFVSGEASTAFWLICLFPLAPRRCRLALAAIALVIAILTSGLRIAFGGHYLSDVVLAGMLSLTTFALLATIGQRLGWYEIRPPRTERVR